MFGVECPYCGCSNFGFETEDLPWVDEETIPYSCRTCDKEFLIVADVSITHHGVKDEDDI